MSQPITPAVTVHNRFDVLSPYGNGESSSLHLGQNNVAHRVSRDDFRNSSIDTKLLHMFDDLRFIRHEQVNNSLAINKFQYQIETYNERLNQVIQVTNIQSDIIKSMAYKSIDSEARDRRDNLLFRGFVENYGENCTEIIRTFLHNRLYINSSSMYIARAHRTGRRVPNKTYQNRPIIVKFRDFGDIEMIMTRVRMLKGTPFSIDYDYPPEIREARNNLWPRLKEIRRNNPRSRVNIVFPAKLIVDDRLEEDALPDWNKNVRANRLSMCDSLRYISSLRSGDAIQTLQQDPGLTHVQMTNTHAAPSYNGPPPPSQQPMWHSEVPMETQATAVPISDPSVSEEFSTAMTPMTPVSIPVAPSRENPIQVVQSDTEIISSNTVTLTDSASNLNDDGVLTNVSLGSDETVVKSVQADGTNPFVQPAASGANSGPVRGRPRVIRSEIRSNKRSNSAKPYRRNSTSRTRNDKHVTSPTDNVTENSRQPEQNQTPGKPVGDSIDPASGDGNQPSVNNNN